MLISGTVLQASPPGPSRQRVWGLQGVLQFTSIHFTKYFPNTSDASDTTFWEYRRGGVGKPRHGSASVHSWKEREQMTTKATGQLPQTSFQASIHV